MKKNIRILGMTYEEYQQKKYQQLADAIMKANGWNEGEYEIK